MKKLLFVLVVVLIRDSKGWWWGGRGPPPKCLSQEKGSWSICRTNRCHEKQERNNIVRCNHKMSGTDDCFSLCKEKKKEYQDCYPTSCHPEDFCCPKECMKPVVNCHQMSCNSQGEPECQTCKGYSNRGAEFSRFYPDGPRSCIPTCFEDSHSCWPGSCGTDYLARSCHCNIGFKLNTLGGISQCELEKKAEMFQCFLGASDQINQQSNSTNTKCNNEDRIFINFRPENIYFKMEAQFSWKQQFSKPSYVKDFLLGIVDGKLVIEHEKQSGPRTTLKDVSLIEKNICSQSFNQNSPSTQKIVCSKEIQLPNYSINYGDKLCATYQIMAGGYLILNKANSQRKFYKTTQNSVTKCFFYDDVQPKHCSELKTCSQSPIQLKSRVSKSANIGVSFTGWSDVEPNFGISLYELTVHELKPSGNALLVDLVNTLYRFSSRNETSVEIQLPYHSGLYALYLSVKDLAGNIQNVRAFVLYDNSSKIETNEKHKMKIFGADDKGSILWLANDNICVSWERYYTNLFLKERLLPIGKDPNVQEHYDPHSGILNVGGTWNIGGISQFYYQWKRNKAKESKMIPVERNQNESTCLKTKSQDADKFMIWVMAADIVGHNLTKNITVFIDRSPPVINNIGLTKDGYENVYIHNSRNLSKMVLKLEILDEHSGLRRIDWKLGTSKGGHDIGVGNVPIVKLSAKENCSPKSCYCLTATGICEMKIHNLTMHSLNARGTHKGQHNRRYYFTFSVENNAGLSSERHVDILVDESPPDTGIVSEGPFTLPDMDFTGEDSVLVHWEGFLDHESGISHYAVAVAQECVGEELRAGCKQCNLSVPLINVKTNFIKISFPSLGKYFTTVVAYNLAMEPSEPICSDGVVYDKTAPKIVDVVLSGSRTWEDFACRKGNLWRVNSDVSKTLINGSSECVTNCESVPGEELLDILKETESKPGSSTSNQKPCSLKSEVTNKKRLIGISSNAIHLSWKVEEAEADLLDFYVGVGSDVSMSQEPDLIGYRSTDQRPEFRKHHLAIDPGEMFYIFISVVNRALISETITLGPIIIDQTPPVYKGNVSIRVSHERLKFIWRNNSLFDPEQKNPFLFYYHIKNVHKDKFVTPLQKYDGVPLSENGFLSISIPLELRNTKQGDEPLIYVCELHVYNMVGLFTTITSPRFQIPEKESFDQGKVIDIDPQKLWTNVDVDIHNRPNSACVKLEGFPNDVQIKIGIGTTSTLADVIDYQPVTNRSRHCIYDKAIKSFHTYYAVTNVSLDGKSSLISSDGFSIVNSNISDLIQVFTGNCHRGNTVMTNLTHSNTSDFYTLESMEDLTIGHEYSVVLDALNQNAKLTGVDIKVLDRHYFFVNSKTYLSFVALSRRPVFRVYLKETSRNISIALSRCPTPQNFQKSATELSAFWNVSEKYSKFITHFQVGVLDQTCLQKNKNTQSCTIKDFLSIGKHFSFTLGNLALIIGRTYSFSVRACMMVVGCTERALSSGTTILNKVPIKGQLDAQISKRDNQSLIEVQWTGFSCISGNLVQKPLVYELTLTDLEGSEIVPPKKIVNNNRSKDRFTCDSSLLEGTDVKVNLEAFCLSGLSTKAFASPVVIQKILPNGVEDICLYEYDTNRIKSHQQSTPDEPILSSHHHQKCLVNDADSIAFRTGRIGAKTIGRNIETKTWYLMSSAKIPEYCCESDKHCINTALALDGAESNYIEFSVKELKAEMVYFVCASGVKYNVFGSVQKFNICGDGFRVDDMLPQKGKVTIENEFNGFISNQFIIASWQGFSDGLPSENSYKFNPKITSYSYFIGSYPSQEDISPIKDIGIRNHIVHENLDVVDGQQVFVGIQAYDLSGQSVTSISDAVTYDTSPPSVGTLNTGNIMAHEYYVDTNELTVYWNGFHDEHSGITSYKLGIGNKDGVDNVIPFQEEFLYFSEIQAKEALKDGQEYYAVLKVTNGAGLSTTVQSDIFCVDSSPPEPGVIIEKSSEGLGDINYQIVTTSLAASWLDFTDPHTSIFFYRVGIGSLPLHDDVVAMGTVGNKTDITWYKDFIPGVKYYVTVEACNRAFLCSRHSSNGIIMDNSPPLVGVVELGMNRQHPQYQAHRSLLNIRWAGFHDPHSGMQKFTYCIGTAIYLCDILSWQLAAQDSSVVVTGIDMPLNKTLFATVKGFNNVGLTCMASSSGFLIDDTPPIIKLEPRLSNTRPDVELETYTTKILPDVQSTPLYSQLSSSSHLSNTAHIIQPVVDSETYTTKKLPDAQSTTLNFQLNSSSYLSNTTQLKSNLSNPANKGVAVPEVVTVTDSSLLHFHWLFEDNESPIVNHFIRIHPHSSGMISLKNAYLPPLNQTTIQLKEKEKLQDGSTYNISMTACNAAGLCTSVTSKQQIFVDSTKPSMGMFIPNGMFWSQINSLLTFNLSWDSFEDSESGIKQYHLLIRDQKGDFLTKPTVAKHYPNKSPQSISIELERKHDLKETVVLEIKAENGAGLYSKVYKISAHLVSSSTLMDFGSIDTQMHSCAIQYCNKDCTCASEGKKCETRTETKCKQLHNAEHPLEFRIKSENNFTASSQCLSAYWTIPSLEQIQRIEWSLGVLGYDIGTGIFDLMNENPWQDVGIQDHATYCLPREKTLETGEKYVFYLRVWYSFNEYALFTSENFVQVDLMPPVVRRGKRIKDNVGSCENTDIDYIVKEETIGACWENVFHDPQSGIAKYIVMAGTAPGLSDLIAPVTNAFNKTWFFMDVSLNRGIKYYFTVISVNNLGLSTSLNSNGFIFDDEPPINGIVYNTNNYRDAPYQNPQEALGVSWHGFHDIHSAIKEYYVAIGMESSNLAELDFQPVGIVTSYVVKGFPIKHNDRYIAYVKASDAAGHFSSIIRSEIINVDQTPPRSFQCNVFSRILSEKYDRRRSSGSGSNGSGLNGSGSSGSGSNRSGSNGSGSNRSGSSGSGSNGSGLNGSGSSGSGSNRSGSNGSGSNRSGSSGSGSKWDGLNTFGLNRSGSDRNGSNWSGLNTSGLYSSGSDRSGSNGSGSNRNGSNKKRSNGNGSNSSGSNSKNRGQFSGNKYSISVDLRSNEFYELKFTIPFENKNQNSMLKIGDRVINVPFVVSGPFLILEYQFLWQSEGKTNITLEFLAFKNYSQTLSVSLSKCISERNSSKSEVSLRQISPTALLLSFNVFDKESGIKQVSVGAGTTFGGFQVNQLQPISTTYGPHIIYNTHLPHGQTVYVTLLVENRVAIETVINDQLVIDHTPPNIEIISSVFENMENEEFLMEAKWKVKDEESKIKNCFYKIGSKSGSSQNLKNWTISPANHSIFESFRIKNFLEEPFWLTVLCTNEANLQNQKESEVKLLRKIKNNISDLKFFLLPTNTWSSIPNGSHVQSNRNQLRVQIDRHKRNYDDEYKSRILEDGNVLVDWIDIHHRSQFTLQDLNLKQGRKYQVELFDVNNTNNQTAISDPIVVDSTKPRLTGSPILVEKITPLTFKLKWQKVFEESPFQRCRYILNIGSERAGTNIVRMREILEAETIITLKKPEGIHVSLTAIYETEHFSRYSQEIQI